MSATRFRKFIRMELNGKEGTCQFTSRYKDWEGKKSLQRSWLLFSTPFGETDEAVYDIDTTVISN